MTYELWDTETNNIVGVYESESDALAVVRSAMAIHGVGYADDLALLQEDTHGNVKTLAVGVALAALARTAAIDVVSARN